MRINQFLIAVCVGTMLTTCSNHSEEEYSLNSTKEIKLTANISNLSTRAADDADLLQNTAFQDDELINIYMTKSDPKWEDVDVYDGFSKNPINSAGSTKFQFRANGGVLNPIHDAYSFRFPESGTVNIYGYYPETVSSTSTSFRIQQDQSTPENYRESDLMVAKLEGVSSSDSPINLKFYHQLVKVIIKLKPGTGMDESDLSGATIKFYSKNTIPITTKGLNKNSNDDYSFIVPVPASGGNDPTSNDGDDYWINLGTYNSNGNAAIVLPTYEGYNCGGDTMMKINVGGVEYVNIASSNYPAFLAGHKYYFEVTVNKGGIKITNSSVEDWTDGESNTGEQAY